MSDTIETSGDKTGTAPSPTRLLIGERDPFMRRALERALASRFTLTFADDGVDLLQRALQEPPDLILLEALLPVKDGFQVCRELKGNPVTRHIPVIFFTLLFAEERARLAGSDAFISKPLHEEELIKTILRFLRSNESEAFHGTNPHEYPRTG